MKNPVRAFKEFYRQRSVENIYRLDGAVPLAKAIPFGLQHVLSMFVANIAPILICFAMVGAEQSVLNNAIRSAIFMAAIGTTIQLFPIWRVGSRLPIVVGVSFTFLGVLGLVGQHYGLGTMFLSIIIGGLVIGILGLFANKWRRIIKPIVSAIVVLSIGLSLIRVGIDDFLSTGTAGVIVDGVYQLQTAWPYLIVAFITLITGILWQLLVKGMWRNISILVGLIVGYLVSLCFIPYNNMVDFSVFHFESVTDIIDVPRPFFTMLTLSWSDFRIGPILIVLLIYFVATTEGIGDLSSLTEAGLERAPTDKELSGGITADGFISSIAGFFGTMPLTTFSQNVGIVGQTKVVNRFVIFQGAILLFLASFFPIIPTFLMTIPKAVLGGTMLMLFASIVIIGMQMISKLGFGKKNILILSLAIGLGYGITLVPSFAAIKFDMEFLDNLWIIMQNPVANMFTISFILSYAIPDRIDKERPPTQEKEAE